MSGKIQSILVGVDFSESAERAIAQALALAESFGARIDLAYVYDIPVVALPELVLPSTNDVSQMADFRQQLKDLRSRTLGDKVPSRVHLRVGEPVLGLLDLIEELHPDLVVVGSHGRGAVMRALLGSVSERLCRRSPIPVLVVPAAGRAEKVKAETEEEVAPATKAGPDELAWSCTRCGHIRKRTEAMDRCSSCGLEPAQWNSAPVTHKPVDELEPAVGESLDEQVNPTQSPDPVGLFPTSPPGAGGNYSINPELRVRY